MDPRQALLQVGDYAIWPYAPRLYPPDTLGVLWRTMYDDRALRRVFYESDTPLALETTVQYFTQKTVLLYLITHEKDLVAAAWFTDVKPYRATIGLWWSRAHQGPQARAVMRALCQWAFACWQWDFIMGGTPWRVAMRHAVLVGFHLVATLEAWVQVGGRRLPFYIVRCTKEDLACPQPQDSSGSGKPSPRGAGAN